MRNLFFIALLSLILTNAESQIDCDKIYFTTGWPGGRYLIYEYDPTIDSSVLFAVTPFEACNSISINYVEGVPTLFTIVHIGSGTYYSRYMGNGTWMTTNIQVGHDTGGAIHYVYSMAGISPNFWGVNMYRNGYQSSGTTLIRVYNNFAYRDNEISYDCIGDVHDNYYLLFKQPGTNHRILEKSDSVGNILCQYRLIGFPIYLTNPSPSNNQTYEVVSGPGFTIIDSFLYYKVFLQILNQSGNHIGVIQDTYKGVIRGDSVFYIGLVNLSNGVLPQYVNSIVDFASCPLGKFANITTDSIMLSCIKDSMNLYATTSISDPIWSWTGPGVISNANTANPTVYTSGYYTVKVISQTDCMSMEYGKIYVDSIEIHIDLVKQDVICNGDATGEVLIVSNTAYTYLWNNEQNDSILTGLSAGTYIVTVTDNLGCTETDTILVTEPLPILISLTIDSINGIVNLGVTGGTSPYSYLWSDGQRNNIATGLDPGNYTVTVTDANGCTETDTITVNDPMLGSITIETENVTVYPNPTSGLVMIKTTASKIENLMVYNALGQRIIEKSATDSIDLSGFPAGTYFLEIRITDGRKSRHKIVKY